MHHWGRSVPRKAGTQIKRTEGRIGKTTAKQAYSIFPLEAPVLLQMGEEEQLMLFVAHC